MRRRLARGTEPPKERKKSLSPINLSSPKTPFYYKDLLVDRQRALVSVILRRSPGEIPKVASLIRDKNTVVMLEAAHAIKYA
jgi:hypothetical protein